MTSAPFSQGAPEVVVLGGTGFVGRALAKTWPAAHRPRYLVHRSFPDWLSDSGIAVQRVDLDDPGNVRAALAGCNVLINLLRPDGHGWYPDLLRRLGPSFREAGLRRCVHASSIDVYAGSDQALIEEETPVQPLSPYEKEHCETERIIAGAFPEAAILRLGAVFGPGGRNVVSFAHEMVHASFPKLALRRALYGERRMYLASADVVARALAHFALDVHIDGCIVVLVTQDDDPDNNFAFLQDTLAESFGRQSLRNVPALPPATLSLALRLRGLPSQVVGRRFSAQKAKSFGLRTDGFGEALRNYARMLAAEAEERRV
ncbi:NAD-dependent epimerase/dehydratase family protein [Nitrobacter sp. TKz-YC01]|uniref:NAD-dependent epimerase/dehydratase family protein n=1 Tax=Nitrobacter sp. TKz-YC01 TaxID=3398703 RepID=UPI003A0FC4D5